MVRRHPQVILTLRKPHRTDYGKQSAQRTQQRTTSGASRTVVLNALTVEPPLSLVSCMAGGDTTEGESPPVPEEHHNAPSLALTESHRTAEHGEKDLLDVYKE